MHNPRSPRRAIPALALALLVSAELLSAAPAAAASEHEGEAGTGAPSPGSVDVEATGRLARSGRVRWSDVRDGHWARRAIDYVGAEHRWMRDYPADDNGQFPFRPNKLEPRKLFFRSAVNTFAPKADPEPGIDFDDLPKSDRFYEFANIAVKLGWVDAEAGRIRPEDPVTMQTAHHVLVSALGLKRSAAGLDRIHTRDGERFDTPANFGTTVIGMGIGLRTDHPDDRLDVTPNSPLPRSEVAWSLYRAKTAASWTLESMERYNDIELPRMSREERRIVEWGIRYAGYPYVWGGEWHRATNGGCCGSQPVGGFDCSGLVWWVMKADSGSWDNTPPRPYRGWSLPQRSSADMASSGKRRGWREIRVGDLLFYDGSGDRTVDHVDVYAGNGWAIDSSGGVGGVTLRWIRTGWYRDNFEHARRIT
jgi:NlpC/P60 family protein